MTTHRSLRLASIIVAGLLLAGAAASIPLHDVRAQHRQVSYAEDLVPIFRGYCVSCHRPGGRGYEASGFDLRTYSGLMKGTKYGRMVVPGQPDISNLDTLIEGRASPKIQMPYQHHPLPGCLQKEIRTWVFQGAKEN